MKKLINFFWLMLLILTTSMFASCGEPEPPCPEIDWLDPELPSLKETYQDIFDSFGFCCTAWQFNNPKVQQGLAKHANSFTLENELKPATMLGETAGSLKDFIDSNGVTIKVPDTLSGLEQLGGYLKILKDNNLKMRGHVLTWHSQTPEWFFAKDYKPTYNGNLISNLVSKEEMTARHEWYIKTILEYVSDWETKNGYGEGNRIIWAWDVVNEAVADDGTKTNYLRGATSSTKDIKPEGYPAGSRWYQIYESDEFIINAFRFANAYAPSDVLLAYNDYNEYQLNKCEQILDLIDKIRNGSEKMINGKSVAPRIDVMGMQSHINQWTDLNNYESCLKKYLNAGLDVHVTEFDVEKPSQSEAKRHYSQYFKMLKKYGKNYSGKNKIRNVTIWGINNEFSWVSKNGTNYPLLFKRKGNSFDSFVTNDSFFAVIDAAK